jgi:very-short-patch-repair endonuclease
MDLFLVLLKQEKLPIPEAEYKFCPDRRWRFDYAYPEQKIAIEQEGGAYSGGRHTRGTGFIKDMEKYNKAVLMGWRVLRYTPDQMIGQAMIDIKEILGSG